MGDIAGAISVFRYYAGWADKIHGQTLEVCSISMFISLSKEPMNCVQTNENKLAYTRHEPYGVVVRNNISAEYRKENTESSPGPNHTMEFPHGT